VKINIIEDDRVFNKMIEYTLTLNPDYEVTTYFNGSDFLNDLPSGPDIVTLDLGLPDYSGNDILKRIKNTILRSRL